MYSPSALASHLFSPFLAGNRVDARLLRALGVPAGDYEAHFGKILDPIENTCFDFYMEGASGRRYFFDIKFSEPGFGACEEDEAHRLKLEQHYRPHLDGLVDAR